MRTFYKMTLATMVAAALMVMPKSADAGFQMTVSSAGAASTVTIDDNNIPGGTGTDLSAAFGSIVWTGTVNGFYLELNTAFSKSTPTAPFPSMSLTYNVTSLTGATADTLTIAVTDTGFTATPMGIQTISNAATFNGTTSTQTYSVGLDNAMYSTTGGTIVGTGAIGVPSNSGNPYSLTLKAVLVTNGSAGVSTGTLQATAAPEPASLAMWGLGAFGMMIARKRRQSKLVA